MLVAPIVVGPWQANCYLLAALEGTPEAPAPCVVVDAGIQAAAPVAEACSQLHLRVAGVLATHGHIDHVGDAAQVADAAAVAVWIHPADEHLLTRPAEGLSGDSVALLERFGVMELDPPREVRHWVDGQPVELAGLRFVPTQAPGHTPGCVLIAVEPVDEHADDAGLPPVVLTGDVVFAGSIGRTDLPGGDLAAMAQSLHDKVLTLPDEAYLLPGHGPATTMAAERAGNPYLQASFLERRRHPA